MTNGISLPTVYKHILNFKTSFSHDGKYFGIANDKDAFIHTTCD